MAGVGRGLLMRGVSGSRIGYVLPYVQGLAARGYVLPFEIEQAPVTSAYVLPFTVAGPGAKGYVLPFSVVGKARVGVELPFSLLDASVGVDEYGSVLAPQMGYWAPGPEQAVIWGPPETGGV